MDQSTAHSKDAQHKNEQKITREHAETLLAGLDDEYVHTVKIGNTPRHGREDTRSIHHFGLLESHEMVYTMDGYTYDIYRIESPLNEEEVAEEIEYLVRTEVGAHKTIPGCETPVEVEYEPAERMESANLDDIEDVDLINVGDQR